MFQGSRQENVARVELHGFLVPRMEAIFTFFEWKMGFPPDPFPIFPFPHIGKNHMEYCQYCTDWCCTSFYQFWGCTKGATEDILSTMQKNRHFQPSFCGRNWQKSNSPKRAQNYFFAKNITKYLPGKGKWTFKGSFIEIWQMRCQGRPPLPWNDPLAFGYMKFPLNKEGVLGTAVNTEVKASAQFLEATLDPENKRKVQAIERKSILKKSRKQEAK